MYTHGETEMMQFMTDRRIVFCTVCDVEGKAAETKFNRKLQ